MKYTNRLFFFFFKWKLKNGSLQSHLQYTESLQDSIMKNILMHIVLLAGDKEKDFLFSCLLSNFQLANEIQKCSKTYKTAYTLQKPTSIASTRPTFSLDEKKTLIYSN